MFNSSIHAEKLGFSHYWLAEHHGSPNYAWANPEILLPMLAGMTSKINIGIAGQLIKHYSPYHVASTFKMLASLFPNRIDLGLAKGAVEKHLEFHFDIRRDHDRENDNEYTGMVKEIIAYLNNDHPVATSIRIKPETGYSPNLWRLSKSFNHLEEAMNLNLNYCVSAFHEAIDINQARIALQEMEDRQWIGKPRPRINICFAGICHPHGAKPHLHDPSIAKNSFKGDVNYFRDIIYNYIENLGVTEFTFLDLSAATKDRRDTLELLAGLL